MTKGYTVHQANAQGTPLCGRRLNRRGFLGKPNVNEDPRFVTCHECQERLKRVVDAETKASQYGTALFTVDELGFIQLADTKVLAAVARGEVVLNAVARRELANRGLDHTGTWVGFPEAARIAAAAGVAR